MSVREEIVRTHTQPGLNDHGFNHGFKDLPGPSPLEEIPRRSFSDNDMRKQMRARSFDQAFDAGSMLFHAKARALTKVFEPQSTFEAVNEAAGVTWLSLFMWVLFGASGWWCGNCIFSELPMFVIFLPEHEKLGNLLALATQLGNGFLILYKVLDHRFDFEVGKVIHAMMAMALAALICCAFLWDASIEGKSIPLLLVMTVCGGVGCMSNATYWALMISFPRICTKAVGLGMSMGGVFSSFLAAAQLSGRPPESPRFEAKTFFASAAGIQALWWVVACVQLRESKRKRSDPSLGGRRMSARSEVLDSLLPRSESDLQRSIHREASALNVCSFVVHATTYTLPSLLPFVASAYPDSGMKQQMLLWMLVLQQLGESTGRIAAPSQAKGCMPVFAIACLTIVFSSFLVSSIHPSWLAGALPYELAQGVLPMMCFFFYFSYGVMQTVIFLRARSLVADIDEAAEIASTMGFMGQMGALTANIAASIVVNS